MEILKAFRGFGVSSIAKKINMLGKYDKNKVGKLGGFKLPPSLLYLIKAGMPGCTHVGISRKTEDRRLDVCPSHAQSHSVSVKGDTSGTEKQRTCQLSGSKPAAPGKKKEANRLSVRKL